MSRASNPWTPKGQQEVQIGSSLNRALKVRMGETPPAKRSGPPQQDFYSVRYNFKPVSLDTSQPGTVTIVDDGRGGDAMVHWEQPSRNAAESIKFEGRQTASKDFECLLIYDEETGSYKLEKLESTMFLTRTSGGANPSGPSTKPPVERSLGDIDAEGESDEELPQYLPPPPQREEEEEDDDVMEAVPVLPPPPPAVKPSKPTPAPKPEQPQRAVNTATARPMKPLPTTKKVTKKAPPPPPTALPINDYEEELHFGRPAKPARPSPPPPPTPVALSLPGSSSGWIAPPAAKPDPPRPASPAVVIDSDEEEEWDEVETAPIADAAGDDLMDELEMELAAEMEEEMEEEPEDFLAGEISQAPDSEPPTRPISMKELAAGYHDDTDDYSSSDSDED
ncbi:unnamed protein product [Mycena citricolor]|uniref:Transcription elongation factor Eaf N-terminal domain-containing protein n=1 Tax=Mycena citricolor TaxID=2018698 RepID=A0AAD2HJ27_9AGAR|nr:unnamed protein product [Mycena citricolor]